MQLHAIISCSALATALLASSAVHADTRYVNKSGADSPTCGSNIASACLTIGTALTNAVAAGNYVRVILTSNGIFQEAVTITTPAELNASGDVVAIIAPPAGQTAITVNAGPNDRVRLLDLYLGGSVGAALDGIRFNSGFSLEMQRTQIRGFGGIGLNFKPSGGTLAQLLIHKSEILDQTAQCVLIIPNAMPVNAVVTDSLIHNCGTLGLRTDSQSLTSGFVRAHLVNTRIFNIGASAVSAFSGAGGGNARVTVEDSTLMHATSGAVANGSAASVILNRATINGTSTGMSLVGGGQFFSYGNNSLNFNATNGPAPTPVAPQ